MRGLDRCYELHELVARHGHRPFWLPRCAHELRGCFDHVAVPQNAPVAEPLGPLEARLPDLRHAYAGLEPDLPIPDVVHYEDIDPRAQGVSLGLHARQRLSSQEENLP